MSNMSYCRFENTYRDLKDCQEQLDDKGIDGVIEGANEYEAPYVKKLIRLCQQIIDDHGGDL